MAKQNEIECLENQVKLLQEKNNVLYSLYKDEVAYWKNKVQTVSTQIATSLTRQQAQSECNAASTMVQDFKYQQLDVTLQQVQMEKSMLQHSTQKLQFENAYLKEQLLECDNNVHLLEEIGRLQAQVQELTQEVEQGKQKQHQYLEQSSLMISDKEKENLQTPSVLGKRKREEVAQTDDPLSEEHARELKRQKPSPLVSVSKHNTSNISMMKNLLFQATKKKPPALKKWHIYTCKWHGRKFTQFNPNWGQKRFLPWMDSNY